MDSKSLDLDHLIRVCEAATPGPWSERIWEWQERSGGMTTIHTERRVFGFCEGIERPIAEMIGMMSITEQQNNAAYIATFNPTVVLSLLHRLQAAEGGALHDQLVDQQQEIIRLTDRLQAAEKRVKLYDELIYAVESKHPDETRHETALRYIREREQPKDVQACKEA